MGQCIAISWWSSVLQSADGAVYCNQLVGQCIAIN